MGSRLKQQLVGEHVRRLREHAGISLRALAARTDFSPSFISQLENGLVSPSIGSMEKIADALGVTLGEFFAAAAGGEGGLVVRADERQALASGWSNAEIASLSPMRLGRQMEASLITLNPGARSGKHPYPHLREEFALVIAGEVQLTLGPDTHRLKTGDAVTILPRELRLWENRSRRPARVLVVTSRSER